MDKMLVPNMSIIQNISTVYTIGTRLYVTKGFNKNFLSQMLIPFLKCIPLNWKLQKGFLQKELTCVPQSLKSGCRQTTGELTLLSPGHQTPLQLLISHRGSKIYDRKAL